MTEVKLAVYDLSHGLARSLSAQFLGPAHAIEIIPHTAILAFGREYYFGGGIQNCTHGEFTAYSGLMPIEIQSLGHTTLTQQQFEAWCTTVGASEFAPESYDLLQHNCNTFSNVAATQGLGLSRGVPQWILDVPGRFLASPMGQMIRPILDNMQLQGPGRVGGGYQRPGMPMSTPAPALAPVPPAAAAAAATMDNPWANVPAKTTTCTDEIKTPILNSHCKPLLSADVNTVKICVTKLVAAAEGEESGNAQKILDELASLLIDPKHPLPHDALEHSAPFLLLNLAPESSKSVLNAVYSLMLLRLIVLHPAADDGARIVLSEIIGIIGGRLIESTKENDELFANHAVRSMAWCTLSNATGTDFGASFLRQDLALRSGLVDAALLDISSSQQPRVEVRQSALAFLYNVAHDLSMSPKDNTNELSDTVVTLLCGMIEGIDEESNSTARLRRLLIVGKILKPNHGQNIDVAAKSLANDLGFVEVIASLRSSNSAGEDNDAKTAKGVATEICLLLS